MLLLLGCFTSVSRAFDAQLQQAQEQLSRLGYDPGVADGIYGPRTRQALEAFQSAQNLPVTGLLDETTLQTLETARVLPADAPLPAAVLPRSPLRIVMDYLRFHGSQPGRALQYVTAHFLNGMDPQLWVEQAMQARFTQALAYMAWKVRAVEITDTQAMVRVHTRVRVHEQEYTRAEVFTLLRTAEDDWLIDAWRLEPLPLEEPIPQAGANTKSERPRP